MYESNEKKMHWKIRSFIAKLLVKVRHRFGIGSATLVMIRRRFGRTNKMEVRPNQQNGGSVVHYRVVCLRLECDLYLNASCIRSRLALHYLRDFFIREVIDSKIEAHQTPEKTKKHVFFLTPLRFWLQFQSVPDHFTIPICWWSNQNADSWTSKIFT